MLLRNRIIEIRVYDQSIWSLVSKCQNKQKGNSVEDKHAQYLLWTKCRIEGTRTITLFWWVNFTEKRNAHNIFVVKSQVRRQMHAIDMFYWQTFKDPVKVTGKCFLKNCEGRWRCVKHFRGNTSMEYRCASGISFWKPHMIEKYFISLL